MWWLDLVYKLGWPIAGAIIVLILGYRSVWVFGREVIMWKELYQQCKVECETRLAAAERREEEWREAARDGRYIARQAADIARDRRPPKDR